MIKGRTQDGNVAVVIDEDRNTVAFSEMPANNNADSIDKETSKPPCA